MKRLIKKESFEMLSSNQSTEATDDLIGEIIKLGYSEENLVSLFRTLNFTRFHLRGMVEKIVITTEMGKNVSELLCVIDTELLLLRMRMQGLLPALPVRPAKKLRWTGRATDLVELLYALDTYACINDGEIGIEELADAFSEILGVEIKNCYNVYMNMKHRKDDSRTYFLDDLREKMNKRMVESDLKGGKYKKR
jgi:rteC protein